MSKQDSSTYKTDTVKLLYKILIQFSIYAHGINRNLDPHLSQIRSTLKQGFDLQKFLPELIELSKTLNFLIESNQNQLYPTASPLFDYLKSTSHTDSELESVRILQQRFENGQFKSVQNLFLAVDQILNSQPKNNSHSPEQKNLIISSLYKILEDSNIPTICNAQYLSLKQQLKPNLSDAAFKSIIDSAVSLFMQIKNQSDSQHLEIEDFLQNMSAQLTSFETASQSAEDSIQQSIINRDIFSSVISDKVANIQDSTTKALDLDSLKHQINQRLNELSLQLQNHHSNEDQQQLETQRQLNELKQKLIDLETETACLRNKLKLEHDKAFKDELTGLPNRMAFDERIMLEQNRWLRYQQPLTLIIWDVDHFKNINDDFGHQAGDKVLIMIAQLIFNNCRATDFVARYGSDKFITLLPHTNAESAMIVAEKIRQIIEKSWFNYSGASVDITISSGICEFSQGDNYNFVFQRADAALCQAKQQGRNRYCLANAEE